VTAVARLRARTWNVVMGPDSSESDCTRGEVVLTLAIESTALVVIDPWADHPNQGWYRRAAANVPRLLRLIQLFRGHERPIFYDATGRPVHGSILEGAGPHDHFIEWDPMGGGTRVLDGMLKERQVRTIFWAGYSANLCLMTKPCGFRQIMPTDWDRRHFLVRDATVAFESNDTLGSQALLDAACYEVEYYPNGYSTTVDDVAAMYEGVT